MQTLREQHDNLESQTAQRFSELLKNREQSLILSTDDENYDDCELVDVYDEVNGVTYSVYVVGITSGGIIKGSFAGYESTTIRLTINEVARLRLYIQENL